MAGHSQGLKQQQKNPTDITVVTERRESPLKLTLNELLLFLWRVGAAGGLVAVQVFPCTRLHAAVAGLRIIRGFAEV